MSVSDVPTLLLNLVDDLPVEHVRHMAALLKKEPAGNWSRLLHMLKSTTPQLDGQERIRTFVDCWQALPHPPAPPEIGLLLESVACALEHERSKQTIELIWTGPKPARTNLRRTDQALIELINTAESRLIIVSFAVYKARAILGALERAALRGVEVKVIIESPDESEGRVAYSTIRALGSSLRDKARVYIWPYARRERSEDGKVGALHAKCAVADGKRLYLSSANLTDYAMLLNMEMGVVLAGSDLPAQVESLLEDMIINGTLAEIAQGTQ